MDQELMAVSLLKGEKNTVVRNAVDSSVLWFKPPDLFYMC